MRLVCPGLLQLYFILNHFYLCSLFQACLYMCLYCVYRVLLYTMCWLDKQNDFFCRLSMAAFLQHYILPLSGPVYQSAPPIHLPIHPPATPAVARCLEVFEPAILAGWGGGGGGGVATFQIPQRNKKQATLQCEADWERATTCLFN